MNESTAGEDVILPSSPKAATYRTDIAGWVSRDGAFFGHQEQVARWSGATHSECPDCHAPCSKGRVRCDPCQEKQTRADWEKLPLVPEFEYPLAIFRGDTFFDDQEAIEEYCDEYEVKLEDLHLVTVEWHGLREVDEESIASESYDGYQLPTQVQAALEALNAAIREHGKNQYYYAGKLRVVLT